MPSTVVGIGAVQGTSQAVTLPSEELCLTCCIHAKFHASNGSVRLIFIDPQRLCSATYHCCGSPPIRMASCWCPPKHVDVGLPAYVKHRVYRTTEARTAAAAAPAAATIATAHLSSQLLAKQKLTREEQISLRNIRAMQVNHEEVDTVLGDRQKRIEDKMMHMQREVESKSKEWVEVRAVPYANSRACPVVFPWKSRVD